jgi:hypothetical protein
MKQIISIFLIIVSLITLSGCKGKESSSKNPEMEPLVCVISIDGTGSYKYLDKAKQIVTNLIQRQQGCNKIYVRWITEDSTSDSNAVASAAFPDTAKPKNPFDVKEKRRYEILLVKDRQIRQQVIRTIINAESPEANRTDIYGALYAAGERFISNSDMYPVLIILSDMEDNVGKKEQYSVNLNGADVIILGYQVSSEEEGRKQRWAEYLSSIGAGSVSFSHIDEPLRFGEF